MNTLPPPLPPMKRMKALGAWLNQLREAVGSLAPSLANTTRTKHTAIGVSHESLAVGKVTSTTGEWFQGEWSPLIQYSTGDGVKISDGLASGFYLAITSTTMVPGLDSAGNTISVADPLTAFPWLGIQWVLLGRIVDQSNWV